MAAKKKTAETSWDEIGEMIGKKIEKSLKDGKCDWKQNKFVFKEEHGGGFGRLLFAVGIMFLLTYVGVLPGLPWWIYLLVVGGFALMKF